MEQRTKDFFIKSKVFVPRTPDNTKRLKVLKFVVIGFCIIIFFGMLQNGVELRELRRLIIPIATYFLVKNRADAKEGFIFTPVEVRLSQSELSMNYPKIDKKDGMGNISETIIFTYNEIHKFEYSKQQQCLRISGRPIIRVKCEDEKKHQGTQVLADANIEKPHLLYLDVENAEEFISELKSYSQIEVTYNDEL